MKRLFLLILAGLLSLPLAAQKPSAPTPAEQALAAYLARVRQVAGASSPTVGSLWTPGGRYSSLSTDFKAQSVNDLITIHIVETTQATGSGTVQQKRSYDGQTGFTGLAGVLASTSKWQSIISPHSVTDLEGQGTAASTSALSTSLTGRVVDQLPNGFLVVEAVRTILMNNEQQTVIVHGVVRPADIAPDNSVLSTQVGDLEVQLLGKGVISEATRPVTSWMRILMHWLTF